VDKGGTYTHLLRILKIQI